VRTTFRTPASLNRYFRAIWRKDAPLSRNFRMRMLRKERSTNDSFGARFVFVVGLMSWWYPHFAEVTTVLAPPPRPTLTRAIAGWSGEVAPAIGQVVTHVRLGLVDPWLL
jgi:hypothetical protein